MPTSWKRRTIPTSDELYSGRGIRWAELLLRSGHPALAALRTQANLRICERNRWNDDIALCHWMLGWCALAEARLDDAQAELRKAEPVLHRGQILFDLARLHVTAGQVALARQDPADALHRAGEALALAAPRGMRLVHADALVVRGRARLLEAETDSAARAADDAEEALRLARDCGYAWAERDALFLQADAHAALAASQDAANPHAARRSRDLARRARGRRPGPRRQTSPHRGRPCRRREQSQGLASPTSALVARIPQKNQALRVFSITIQISSINKPRCTN